jgi:hypothetical protein
MMAVPSKAIPPISLLGLLADWHRHDQNRKEKRMLKLALFARFEAKPGKEAEVENLLKMGLELVHLESSTPLCFRLD